MLCTFGAIFSTQIAEDIRNIPLSPEAERCASG